MLREKLVDCLVLRPVRVGVIARAYVDRCSDRMRPWRQRLNNPLTFLMKHGGLGRLLIQRTSSALHTPTGLPHEFCFAKSR